MERKAYIQNNDDKAALSAYLSAVCAENVQTETIAAADALDRVAAFAVYAKKCDPMYNAAAMDGIAVAAEDTLLASENVPLRLKRGVDFEFINTGGALLGKFNAVIMIEDVILVSSNSSTDKAKTSDNSVCDEVEIIAPAYPWQHVRVVGESIVVGEIVIPSGHVISPADIGALIASGNIFVDVVKKPRVGIIPTGAEMIDDPDELSVGKLMESNSKVFAALTTKYGGIPVCYKTVPDDIKKLEKTVKKAVKENDFVIINAGSSAGTKDHTVKVVEALGKVLTHGIAIKPGKPTILGIIDKKPVIGIPGYPVSAYLVFDMFAKEVISALAKKPLANETYQPAVLTRRITSSFKNAELVRVAMGEVDKKIVATPLGRGAAAIMSLVRADGLLRVERNVEGIEAGEIVNVRLQKPLSDIKKSLVIIGSHDMIIDIIADKIAVSSAHVGSMGGIFALQRNECHIAPIHLLDEDSGRYNIPYAEKYFSGQKMALIKGVGRVQGFVVPKGNPKNIATFCDLAEKRLTFANRQRGAGTRILFDFNLKKHGLSAADIIGYEKEFDTHLSVAVAVHSGAFDAGLAVLSAAKALDLDFVPVGNEQYDFLLPCKYLDDERVQKFVEVIKSDFFKTELDKRGGYTFGNIGEITIIDPANPQ